MPTMDSYAWQEAHLGGRFGVYPGHPIVTASMIMDRYANLDEALSRRRSPNGEQSMHGNALSDSFIPGAGCAVHAGLGLLGKAMQAFSQQEAEAVADALASDYWDAWERQSPEHNRACAEKGRAIALGLRPAFCERLAQWRAGLSLDTPYRWSQDATA